MIIKATKKPVTIECIQWTGDNFEEIRDWCGQIEAPIENCPYNDFFDVAYMKAWDVDSYASLTIRTLEGDHKAIIGDYIIKGVHGEFYPCKEDIFHKTYDINKEN